MSNSDWTNSFQQQGGWSCFNFVAPIFSAPLEALVDAPPDEDPPLHIFILAGQSNMAGRGGVIPKHEGLVWDGLLPKECRPLPGKILRFSSISAWEDACEPGHHDIDSTKICGVGPGLPFANCLLEMGYPRSIGLVPCAIGGTDIDLWQEGSKLFNNTVQRATAALAASPNSHFAGVLWYQGESDADTEDHSVSYKGKLESFTSALRNSLHAPHLPIVQVAISSTRPEVPFVNKIREAQFGATISAMVTVDAKGLDLQDGFHLSTDAQCRLAKDMAIAYMANFFFPVLSNNLMDAPKNDEEMENT